MLKEIKIKIPSLVELTKNISDLMNEMKIYEWFTPRRNLNKNT